MYYVRDATHIIVVLLLLLVLAVLAVLALSILSVILVPIILGGIAALLVSMLVGWASVSIERSGSSYTLSVRVSDGLPFLLLWLVLAVVSAVLLHH